MPIACIFSHLFEKRVFKETLGHKKANRNDWLNV
jgi:hypothetical protein